MTLVNCLYDLENSNRSIAFIVQITGCCGPNITVPQSAAGSIDPELLTDLGAKLFTKLMKGISTGAYAQELFTQEAIDYINQPHANPFFVFLAFSSPHAELAAPQRYVKPYETDIAQLVPANWKPAQSIKDTVPS